MSNTDDTPPDPFPPTSEENLRAECFFLLKRCEDLLAHIDGIDPAIAKSAGVDFARHSVRLRVARRDSPEKGPKGRAVLDETLRQGVSLEVCPVCSGRGFVVGHYFDTGASCTTCGGTGSCMVRRRR